MKFIRFSIPLILLFGLPFEGAAGGLQQTLPTHRKDVQFLITKEKPDSPKIRLFTLVAGKQHEIDSLFVRRSLSCMDECGSPKLKLSDEFSPQLAPDGETVLYSNLTGCGFEGDGSALSISDLEGKERRTLVARCNFVNPLFFFQQEGEWYLAVEESNSGIGRVATWIFHLKTRQPIVRVGGELSQPSQGSMKFCEINEGDPCTTPKKINVSDLLQRKGPLPYLPRYPLQATVKKRGAVWVPREGPTNCIAEPYENEKPRPVPVKTSVAVLETCEDGSVEIWLGDQHGTMKGTFLEGHGLSTTPKGPATDTP